MKVLFRVLAILVLGVVAGGFGGFLQSQPYSVSSDSTVEVINVGEGLGAGVVIKPGYTLTANHVIDGAKSVKVMRRDGQTVDAVVLWQDKSHDVAGVGFSSQFKTRVSYLRCDYEPRIGDRIEAVGQPTGMLFVHTFGRVAALGDSIPQDEMGGGGFPWPEYFVGNLTINPGNSGGPVYDDSGRVVGLATGERILPEPVVQIAGASATPVPGVKVPVPTGLAFIVPSRTLCAAVEAHKSDDLTSVVNRELQQLKKDAAEKKASASKVSEPATPPKAEDESCKDKMGSVATVKGKAAELKRKLVQYEGDGFKAFVKAVITVMPATDPSTFKDYDAAYIADLDESAPDKKIVFLAKDGCVVSLALIPTELAEKIEAAANQPASK